MRCKQVKDLIVPYIEQELAPASAVLIHVHLKKCPSCSMLEQRMRAFQLPSVMEPTVLQTLQMHHILETRIEKEWQTPHKPRMRRIHRLPAAAAPLALVLIGIIGLTLWIPKHSSSAPKYTPPPAIGVTTPVKHWF
jgi:predicted anti-sigma-YlaC factor YlaD